MARLVVVHPHGQDEELWIITDAGHPVDADTLELIKAWPGRKRGINHPKVSDYHAWQRQLRDRNGGITARCPECSGSVSVRPYSGDMGWHWFHPRLGDGCRVWRNETDAHFKRKNQTAAIARELGLQADVEKVVTLADGTWFKPDVLISGGSQAFPLDWEVEETGHRNLTALEDWYRRRELLTPRRVLEMTYASYRPNANVPQLLRDRDRIVDGIVDMNGNPIERHREDVVEAVCLGRVALTGDNQWRWLTNPPNWNPKLTPVAKPKQRAPRDVAGATPWPRHLQPNYAQPGRPPPGAPTPSSSTAASSEPSIPWTQPTLYAELSKNSPPPQPLPGFEQLLKPTGTDGTHPTSAARTVPAPTPSADARNSPQPQTTAPALTVVPPTPPTPNASSPSPPASTTTTTATAPPNAKSAASTTSPPTPVTATPPNAAPAATNFAGRGATYPAVRSAVAGEFTITDPAPCRHCDELTWLADIEGPAHVCCVLWAKRDPGRPCQACAESRRYWRTKARRVAS
jgi:hypothetical protein